jgi:type II secretory pathway predicted ATPase ExeA
MYRSHWHLRTSPFRSGGASRYFHRGAAHEEAIARLGFLVDDGRRLGLLLGESGVGKTLVLSVLARLPQLLT